MNEANKRGKSFCGQSYSFTDIKMKSQFDDDSIVLGINANGPRRQTTSCQR